MDSITGEQLLRAVSQNSFIGFSGLISYNRTTTNRINGTLNVYQIVQSYQTVGQDSSYLVPTPETTDLSSGFWPCFVLSLSILGLVLAACVFAFIIWKWNTPTVRKAGHIFLILILAGICCIFTANLLWSVQVSILICTIKGILSYLGVTLCCG